MSTILLERPLLESGPRTGGLPARRAVSRWAWRLFVREWRQQLLVLVLIVVAVAATVVGAAVAANSPAPADASFGTAQDLALFQGFDSQVSARIASLQHRFGRVDVIANERLAVPGSVSTFDLRAQSPDGAFGRPLLSLVSGRYPSGADDVALTAGLASELHLGVGDLWHQDGRSRRVVGIVENPQSLLDAFALVAPGQVPAPDQMTVLFDAHGVPADAIGPNVQSRSSASNSNGINPETISLAGLTVGMILIALVAVGGFTVLAQRRLRSLGMLASLGATNKNVSFVVRANGMVVGVVGAVLGTALGVVLWLAYRPHLESSSHHVIGLFALPWLVVALAAVLAMLAAYFAASRPARAVTRVPVVTALSGRPPSPRKVRRSAVPGIVFLVIAFFLLGYSGGRQHYGQGGGGMVALVLGLVALIPGVILLAPFCLSALARLGGRAPIAVRLALRDLARYRARSGSALSAISIGVLIAVIIAIVASARYGNALDYAGPNLASNQLVLWTSNGPGYAPPGIGPGTTADELQAMSGKARAVASSLSAEHVVTLESMSASLNHNGPGRNWNGAIYVATPGLLHAFGINALSIAPDADILTMRPGMSTLTKMQLEWCSRFGAAPQGRPIAGPGGPKILAGPPCTTGGTITPVIQEVSALPSGTSAPNTVITENAVQKLGLQSQLQVSGWLIQTPQPLTASQINSARLAATSAGMTLESKNDQPTSAEVINWATVFGIALALAILAMSVGLIRSETAGDLRTLAATGASSRTRRTLTAATAGGLGFLGALLGTVAGYIGVIGYLRSNSLEGGVSALGNIPVRNLLVILVGMPLAATAVGWLLAGREPPALAHQPIE